MRRSFEELPTIAPHESDKEPHLSENVLQKELSAKLSSQNLSPKQVAEKYVSLPEDLFQEGVKQAFVARLSKDKNTEYWFKQAKRLKEEFGLSDEDVSEATNEVLSTRLRQEKIDDEAIHHIIHEYRVNPEDTQRLYKEAQLHHLAKLNMASIARIHSISGDSVSIDFEHDPEARKVIQEAVAEKLSDDSLTYAQTKVTINELLHVMSKDSVREIVGTYVVARQIEKGNSLKARALRYQFGLTSKESINRTDLHRATLKGIRSLLENQEDVNRLEKVEELLSEFPLSQEAVEQWSAIEKVHDLDQVHAQLVLEKKIYPPQLIKFLGSENIAQFLPVTTEKAQQEITAQLENNEVVARLFVDRLGAYHQKSWAIDKLPSALKHPAVAKHFLYLLENYNWSWENEPWVKDMHDFAKIASQNKKMKQSGVEAGKKQAYGYGDGAVGFAENDPYKDDPNVFGPHYIRFSNQLTRALEDINVTNITAVVKKQKPKKEAVKFDIPHRIKGLAGEEVMDIQAGIDENYAKNISPPSHEMVESKLHLDPESRAILGEINEKINKSYERFLEKARQALPISEVEILDNFSGTLNMTPLLKNVRSFVARYIVQSVQGDLEKLPQNLSWINNQVEFLLDTGFETYLTVHEIDIPLYDKVYEEFDELRLNGRHPLEVYLGRDGIYAYIGRRAQNLARQRNIAPEVRKKFKAEKKVFSINPHYLVYPRYFRDELNYETKREFLEQERVSLKADPYFYDTGYTGTIPEQIMRVMDFPQEEVDERIRLLSANQASRRIRGIEENVREDIIEFIEHNAKTEESAVGLIRDERTGKIRHIAPPTSPREQFKFMMIKQAIARHYWMKERV